MKATLLRSVVRRGVLSLLLAATALPAYDALAADGAAKLPPPPRTKKQPVVDVHHGVKVTDDYRWLEEMRGYCGGLGAK